MLIRSTRAGHLLVAAILLAAFGLLLALVAAGWPPLARLDADSLGALHGFALRHPAFVLVMRLVSRGGSGSVYTVLAVLLALWLLRSRAFLRAAAVVVVIAGSAELNLVVKDLVHRARPVWVDPVERVGGLGFPSGHAQSAIVGYGTLLLVVLPALSGLPAVRAVVIGLAVSAVAVIGFSRVALGVHYPSDVLGGYLLGAGWLLALFAALPTALPTALPAALPTARPAPAPPESHRAG